MELTDKQREFLLSLLSGLQFKAGQKEMFDINEDIIKKLKEPTDG